MANVKKDCSIEAICPTYEELHTVITLSKWQKRRIDRAVCGTIPEGGVTSLLRDQLRSRSSTVYIVVTVARLIEYAFHF
jgi:hypothetical protein